VERELEKKATQSLLTVMLCMAALIASIAVLLIK
jgi:hypothetical protein